jgi:hypothetical protein
MRDSYEDSPAGTRDAGLRRLGRLTWRTTQLGALATVGFAIVFARTAPAPAANVQTVPPAQAPTATAAATHAPGQPGKKPRVTASKHPASTRPAAKSTVAPSGGQQAGQPAAQPTPQPTAQAPAPSPKPTLAPPTTAPTAAPSTSAPAPTATSTTHTGA